MQYLNSFCSFDLNNITSDNLTKFAENRRRFRCIHKAVEIKGITKKETK